MTFLKSRNVMASFAVLVVGGVLISRYGLPQSLRLLGKTSHAGPPLALQQIGASPQTGASREEREAAYRRRQKEVKLQQQKTAAMPQHR